MVDYNTVGDKVTHVIFGLYAWEWCTSLDFEWQIISGKRKFKWPLIFYFLNRYFMLTCAIAYLVLWDVRDPAAHINCKALFALVHLCGSGALGLASANLAIRTIAIWNQNRYVTVSLTILMLAHLALVIADTHDAARTAELVPYNEAGTIAGCVNSSTGEWLRIIVVATMTIDFIVLVLSVYKIGMTSKSVYGNVDFFKLKSRAFFKLTFIVLKQGVIYFLIAFCVHLAQITILSIPSLEENGMNRVFILPSYVISTIVACRAVRALTTFVYEGSGVHVTSTLQSATSGRARLNPSGTDNKAPIRFALDTHQQGVLVQMETISRDDSLHLKPAMV